MLVSVVREEAKAFLKTQRMFLSILILSMIFFSSVLLASVFENSAIAGYLIEVSLFMLISVLQLSILDAYRDKVMVDLKIYLSNLKQFGLNLFVLGMMVQALAFVLANVLLLVLNPIFKLAPSALDFLINLMLSFLSLAISHLITYMFLFAVFYIKDRKAKPYEAFMLSLKETKHHKLKMFNIELPYLMSVIAIFLISILFVSVLKLPTLGLFGLILSFIFAIYLSVDLITLRTLYYAQIYEKTL